VTLVIDYLARQQSQHWTEYKGYDWIDSIWLGHTPKAAIHR